MRLGVFLFVCFAASIAVNATHQKNSVASEHVVEKAIPSQMNDLSDEPPPAVNSTMNRRLKRQSYPYWCQRAPHLVKKRALELPSNNQRFKRQNCHNVLSQSFDDVYSCGYTAFPDHYVVRVKDIKESTWEAISQQQEQTYGWNTEIHNTELTHVNVKAKEIIGERSFVITNNPLLETIYFEYEGIDGQFGTKMNLSRLEIRGNPKLGCIRIDVEKEFFQGKLTIADNPVLEDIVLILDQFRGGSHFTVINNVNLGRIWVKTKEPTADNFDLPKLEIVRNDHLIEINLGDDPPRWKNTHMIIRENKNLTAENLEALKDYAKDGSDIQKPGEDRSPTSIYAGGGGYGGGGGYSDDSSSTRGRAIPVALLSSLVFLGY